MSAPVCNSLKQGEYNMLRCVCELGHTGDHCYVVVDKWTIRRAQPRRHAGKGKSK